ncbi:MAG: diguanylate cyclase [Acidobacteriota bacterium]|nr:diguanylate cyclase [Acidobacteriota bacterium]
MRILIAEDDPVSSHVLATTLTRWGHEVVTTDSGLEAWDALQKDDAPPLAIIDWMMPGIEGPEVCRRVRQNIKTAPTYIILLTTLRQKEQMVAGLEAGADDYLTKPFDRNELRVRLQAGARIVALQSSLAKRVLELEGAIAERQRAEDALRNLSLTDDLTGLYNHRGFFNLAQHHLKTARRARQSSLLFYADLDSLKEINDGFGHSEGSSAIARTARILSQTFRNSDIVSRLGGDEFAILAQSVSFNEMDTLTARLEENLRKENQQQKHGYLLSLSVGAVWIAHDSTETLKQLLDKADKAMYDHKRGKTLLPKSIVHGDFHPNEDPPPSSILVLQLASDAV